MTAFVNQYARMTNDLERSSNQAITSRLQQVSCKGVRRVIAETSADVLDRLRNFRGVRVLGMRESEARLVNNGLSCAPDVLETRNSDTQPLISLLSTRLAGNRNKQQSFLRIES